MEEIIILESYVPFEINKRTKKKIKKMILDDLDYIENIEKHKMPSRYGFIYRNYQRALKHYQKYRNLNTFEYK
jgi:hypothetical protein